MKNENPESIDIFGQTITDLVKKYTNMKNTKLSHEVIEQAICLKQEKK